MADYIYTMESRLTPDQMRVVTLVQQIARSHGANLYLTGGAIRDILTGFPIRDLDLTVQGNPLKFQKALEAAGGVVDMVDTTACVLHVVFGGVRAEIGMARSEHFEKPGKAPTVTPATINDDLRRRDFTFNAMALSLNEGSRGLLLDPSNGAADIEARLVRTLHSYAFLDDPSRLIRAIRFATRFGWELEEKTRARYEAARENGYIEFLGSRATGYEIEQIAHEENPIAVMRALEVQGWLKVLHPRWTVARADVPELAELLKTRDTMTNLNIAVDAAPAVMHFLTLKLADAEITAIQKIIPHREFVASWKRLEDDARELSKRLQGKEAATSSGAWKLLAAAKPEALLYLDVTGRNKAVDEKIKSYLGKWRQVQEQIPLAKMAELRITPQLPEYPQIWQEAFFLLLDGKLRNEAEIASFLAPYEPPPPPPPPAPVRRGRTAAKKAATPAKPVASAAATEPAAQIAVAAEPKTVPAATQPDRKAAPAKVAPAAKPAARKVAEPRPAAKKAPKPAPRPTAKKAAKKPATKAASKASKPAGKSKATKPVKAKPAKAARKAEKKKHGGKADKHGKKHRR